MTPIKDYSGLEGTAAKDLSLKSKEEVIKFFETNDSSRVRIGGGLTGVNGAAVPLRDEIYLDTRSLNNAYWFDEDAGILIAECGTTLQSLESFCKSAGWRFPIIPGSLEKATIGGLVAFNGGSSFSHKYGKIENYVLGLEVVLSDGRAVLLGSYNKKVSEGPLHHKSIIGSEGTLCFIHAIIIKCLPLEKKNKRVLRLEADELDSILNLLPSLTRMNCEFIEVADENSMELIGKPQKAVCWVLGDNLDDLETPGCKLTFHDEEILTERYSIGHAIAKTYNFFDYDISFPLKHTKSILETICSFSAKHKIQTLFFGHAGDGNWHVHLLLDQFTGDLDSFLNELDHQLIPFACQLSGEHGIGRLNKSRFLNRKKEIEFVLYQNLKQVLDPKNILPNLYEP